MVLADLKQIESILQEKAETTEHALVLFKKSMCDKYEEGLWFEKFEKHLNNTEKSTYEKLYADMEETHKVLDAFREHNWM